MTLKSPQGLHTRPTASRVREAVWNSLQADVQNADIMDLFSGTGAFGIEGISRGARSVVFVDNDREAQFAIMANIALVEERAIKQDKSIKLQLLKMGSQKAINGQKGNKTFDIIWLDPPYAMAGDFIKENLQSIAGLLSEEGAIIVESDVDIQDLIQNEIGRLEMDLIKQKAYGKTLISIIRK